MNGLRWILISSLPGLACLAAESFDPIPRRLPPPGQSIPAEASAKLHGELKALREQAAALRKNPLYPDAEIFLKAVDLALEFGEFYKPEADLAKAEAALGQARTRLASMKDGQSPWTGQKGLVVRGYRSAVDGSAQPYGLEIPEGLDLEGRKVPLYVWLHGRGDAQTDLHFIDERSRRSWPFQGLLGDGLVLHPFGRQCIGYKSAGEIDVLDAVDHVVANYPVDPDRIALMGFSMGGAGAWHLGAHYADRWAVVHAGAGFVDVKRYQNLKDADLPPLVEQTLWGAYDVPDYARNLFNIPLVAYSGENDKQKDAADFMSEVLAAQGRTLTHYVGPGMGHKYHPETLKGVAVYIREALRRPKNRDPKEIHWQTRTLRYPRYAWLELTGMGKHWADARVDAVLKQGGLMEVSTRNVTSFRVTKPLPRGMKLMIDGTVLTLREEAETLELRRAGESEGEWRISPGIPEGLVKSPHLQGPIDDAFLAPFLVVTPSGHSTEAGLDRWVDFELEHFRTRWRALFRGDLRMARDDEVTPEDMKKYHLVLFGTPESNKLMEDVLKETALVWPEAAHQVLLGIYPNPAAPGRYVVLNTGPTFREADDRTNSLQNPKLGDWAVLDISEPPGAERAGRIVRAGFFDEKWRP